MKKTVRDIGVKGKRVLVRCDFNVPMNGTCITDDVRIKAALPTIEHLIKNGPGRDGIYSCTRCRKTEHFA